MKMSSAFIPSLALRSPVGRKAGSYLPTRLFSYLSSRLDGLDKPTVWNEFSPLATKHGAINLVRSFSVVFLFHTLLFCPHNLKLFRVKVFLIGNHRSLRSKRSRKLCRGVIISMHGPMHIRT